MAGLRLESWVSWAVIALGVLLWWQGIRWASKPGDPLRQAKVLLAYGRRQQALALALFEKALASDPGNTAVEKAVADIQQGARRS